MSTLRLILGDQLSLSISSLQNINFKEDTVMLCEVMEECTYVKHHKKKIAFILSSMRHFAQELSSKGITVRYVELDNAHNTGSIYTEIIRAVSALKPNRFIVTEPSEYRLSESIKSLKEIIPIPVDILSDDRFLSTSKEFSSWAHGKKQLRMEFFYREMRQKYKILLEPDEKPTGGQWNYDKENQTPLKTEIISPKRISHKKSTHIKNVLKLVNQYFPDNFGTLDHFHFAVTREQALIEFHHFVDNLLPKFGDYQDVMVAGEPYLYHSLISCYLNAGLILPLEVCQIAEKAYKEGQAPLNSVEGFIRQILGWREYIRGIYWYHMPRYAKLNYLNATTKLPDFYWTTKTEMFCVAESIRHTRDHAYSHHIQRLMVTGNFAMLAGLDVAEVQAWYLAVYADAYEWVEMPNTLGMALFGDNNIVASKPYAASGKYIHRMSNFCQNCKYNPNEMIGEKACPFNSLYWDFWARHEDKLKGNPRVPYVFSTWNKMSIEKRNEIRKQATANLKKMRDGSL